MPSERTRWVPICADTHSKTWDIRYNGLMQRTNRHIHIWLIVLIVGLVFVTIGLVQGDFTLVLRRAQLICYECMGLG